MDRSHRAFSRLAALPLAEIKRTGGSHSANGPAGDAEVLN